MNYPLISVIVPVYNVELYLARCLDSILKQDYKNFEVVLIDDGSTDNSGKICDAYAEKNAKVRVIHQNNGGVSAARNMGMRASKGDLICFVDSDDYLPDNSSIFTKAYCILEQENVDIVTWLWQFEDDKGNWVIKQDQIPDFFKGKQNTREFAKGLYQGSYANGLVVSLCNKLCRKNYMQSYVFDGQIYEDDHCMTTVLAQEGSIFCQREFWYVYAQNNSSLTHRAFTKDKFHMLRAIAYRASVFADDAFICRESMKLYLNLYIEYWYKACSVGIAPYQDKKIYKEFMSQLYAQHAIDQKTWLRFTIFSFSPTVYKWIVLRGKDIG